MSDKTVEYLSTAPFSKKPYLRMSYYDFQEWMQVINDDMLTKYEMIRLKNQMQVNLWMRSIIQFPIIGVSLTLGWLCLGPGINRGIAGRRETFVVGTFWYILLHHYVDKKPTPWRYLDEIFSQQSPHGDEVRKTTKYNLPGLYEDISAQYRAKGIIFPEYGEDD